MARTQFHPNQLDLFAAPPRAARRQALAEHVTGARIVTGGGVIPAPPSARKWPKGAVRGTHTIHAGDDRPYWKTSAYDWNGEILAYPERPAPFELEVMGVRCVVAFGFGFSTHAVDAPGSLFWSDTGFRSFTCSRAETPDDVRAEIEAHIAGPAKHGGCAGKLRPWGECLVFPRRQQAA